MPVTMNKNTYKLTESRFEHTAGTVVYEARVYDYGLARDDTLMTDVEHISVTLDVDGGYPVFTVPVDAIEPLTDD